MDYKTITTVLTDKTLCKSAFDAAAALCRLGDAHLNAICLGLDHSQQGFYYAGASAMVIQDNLAQAREDARETEEYCRSQLGGAAHCWSTSSVTAQMVALNGLIAHHTRFSDLVILPRPYGEGRGHEMEAIVEAALFDGSVPVMVMPDGTELPETIGNVVVAWNESTEALRAIRHAMPILSQARNVSIAIIDPPTHGPERSDPGGSLTQMLSRHGVRAEVSVMAKTLPRISDILNRHARDKDADLIVMGAYGHSRFRESILGGATRHMLEVAEKPVFLAH
ncbi:Nucleotide-binding universal stress protein, UspA family [Aliiroseovarius crassostreae]|uniref:Universal stress protein n=1 Tax=Aliiroseovarius crassostreae TaxID=154981 RepID=A0A0N8IC12_9RHOB|nr:universal stress protein [Aliiroseovarius crassostreae]KPN64619.1 universal stress protein [Aliiroseovarius crassostreae]SFU32733.1 Nucleotide-binding universal stress protein, UspA family [Aliiroseovarius crassostreae]